MLRVLVIGSIGNPGETGRRDFVAESLKSSGKFDVIVIESTYEDKDWKYHLEEAKEYLEKTRDIFAKGNFDVVVADLSEASDGRTNEQIIAGDYWVPVYGFVPDKVKITKPWRVAYTEKIFFTTEGLIAGLVKLQEELTRERNKRRLAEERKMKNPFYRWWGRGWENPLIFAITGIIITISGIILSDIAITSVGVVIIVFIVFLGIHIKNLRKRSY